jgi:anti-anti-sigma factor
MEAIRMKQIDLNLNQSNLSVRKESDFVVLCTEGYINHLLSQKIADEIYSLINAGYKKFVLNLEKSRIISSVGLSIFAEIFEKVRKVNGTIFCCLSPIMAKSFRIMGFTQLIRTFETERAAAETLFRTLNPESRIPIPCIKI